MLITTINVHTDITTEIAAGKKTNSLHIGHAYGGDDMTEVSIFLPDEKPLALDVIRTFRQALSNLEGRIMQPNLVDLSLQVRTPADHGDDAS